MSCIRFNTPAQRQQLDLLRQDAALANEAIAKFSSPPVTESKIARLQAMAADKNFKIRESAALSYHLPEADIWRLAKDKVESVRVCVARNETTPCDILRELAKDKSTLVRSWVAVNFFVPADVMEDLANDPSEDVRALVAWKANLAAEAEAEALVTQ